MCKKTLKCVTYDKHGATMSEKVSRREPYESEDYVHPQQTQNY